MATLVTQSISTATSSSSVSIPPPSPTTGRRRPPPLRLNPVGIDPSDIIGKVLKRARRSTTHPAVTLDFSDATSFQILVDGYDPVHRGIPKELEMDATLDEILSSPEQMELQVLDCALVTLSDKAFARKHDHDPEELQWDQKHLGVAFKFAVENPKWHCVWAAMEEHDENQGTCVFRSYDDVYLEKLHRPSKKHIRSSSWIHRRKGSVNCMRPFLQPRT